jgi:lysozyme family protein
MKWLKKYWWIVLIVALIVGVAIILIYRFVINNSINKFAISPVRDSSNDTSMQDIIDFIKAREGGYVNNPADDGGETNKGVTYATWCQFFGANAHDRFMAMSDADWSYIFTNGYWNAISGDQINSVMIANFLADWYWGSGSYAIGRTYYGVEYGIQAVLNSLGANIAVDGGVGPMTLAAINAADVNALYSALVANRTAFYQALAANESNDALFLTGWENRIKLFTESFKA